MTDENDNAVTVEPRRESIPPLPQIEGFKLLHRLGRGGMATVYLAEEEGKDRKVALKLLPKKSQEMLQARFELEGHIGERLQHPDIVSTYAHGTSEEHAWIAMEYLDGFELTQAVHDPELGFEDRVRILGRVAAALQHAHEEGIVHRDVKPSNIFMTHEGDVRLLDFGVARYQDVKLTQSGHVVGTPRYMAPEQLLGYELDGRADIFSLGIVAFELFSGVSPWNEENYSALAIAICTRPPTALKSVVSKERYGLTEARLDQLHEVVHWALAADAEDRYETSLQFAQALEGLLRPPGEKPIEGTRPALEMLSAKSIEWAKARAARLQLQTPKEERPAIVGGPSEEDSDRSRFVWWLMIIVFAAGLAAAFWAAQSL